MDVLMINDVGGCLLEETEAFYRTRAFKCEKKVI